MNTYRPFLSALPLASLLTGCGALHCDDLNCSGDEYCIFSPSDVGRDLDATCEPLPEMCAEDPTCACLEEQELNFAECEDTGSQVNVTGFGG